MNIINFVDGKKIVEGAIGLDKVSLLGMTLTVDDGKKVRSLNLNSIECEMISAYWELSKKRNQPNPKKKLINGRRVDNFIEFLEKTLIPDLIESGKIHTAKDFKTAVKWIKHFKGDV